MNKATLFCFIVFLFGQVFSQTVFPIEHDVPFSASVGGLQTVYFKVLAPAESDVFAFTVSPCAGHIEWWVGPKAEVVGPEDQRNLYTFNSNPVIYVTQTDFENSIDIVTVSTFTMIDYSPGYYFVGVKSSDLNVTASFEGYFGVYNPYPQVGGDGNINVVYTDSTTANLYWDPSPSSGVEYCVYAQEYSDYYNNINVNHGSSCGVPEDNLLECTSSTSFTVSNLFPKGTYVFDVLVRFKNNEDSLVSAYNGVLSYVEVTYYEDFYGSASSLAVFGVATIFAILISFF